MTSSGLLVARVALLLLWPEKPLSTKSSSRGSDKARNNNATLAAGSITESNK